MEETNCLLKSEKAATTCEFKPKNPGYYQFIASIKDSKERDHKTTLYGWVKIGRASCRERVLRLV